MTGQASLFGNVDPASEPRPNPREEERQARLELRRRRKLEAGAARYRARKDREKLAQAIAETAKTHPGCRCQLRANMTDTQLRALGGGCTMPAYACPRLDTVRRRIS